MIIHKNNYIEVKTYFSKRDNKVKNMPQTGKRYLQWKNLILDRQLNFIKKQKLLRKYPKDQIEHCKMVWNKEWKMKTLKKPQFHSASTTKQK